MVVGTECYRAQAVALGKGFQKGKLEHVNGICRLKFLCSLPKLTSFLGAYPTLNTEGDQLFLQRTMQGDRSTLQSEV